MESEGFFKNVEAGFRALYVAHIEKEVAEKVARGFGLSTEEITIDAINELHKELLYFYFGRMAISIDQFFSSLIVDYMPYKTSYKIRFRVCEEGWIESPRSKGSIFYQREYTIESKMNISEDLVDGINYSMICGMMLKLFLYVEKEIITNLVEGTVWLMEEQT
jgi:hypothetical protein